MKYHPLPQPDEIEVRVKEDALGAYLMMFATAALGLPLPILNLVLLNPMFQELENDKIDSLLQVIGDRLSGGLNRSEFDYRFIVIDSEMINAFTVPGGNILISTGLIGFCESPEELAAVIAHEMGHVEKRHVVARRIKELGIEILTSGDPYVLGEVAGMLTSTRFDRKQEEETDNALLKHFEIISTHPNLNSRIREMLTYMPEDGFTEEPFALDWAEIKSGL